MYFIGPPDTDLTPNNNNDDDPVGGSVEIPCSTNGALGIHRITLWIIVLVISLVQTAMISLL